MCVKIPKSEKRTLEQLRKDYEIEKELAKRLRNASREERRHLYTALYDEMYRRVPYHPQLTRKTNPESRLIEVSGQMRLLKCFLKPEFTFLEVGPGDCRLSLEVTEHVKKVYAIDVSEEITKGEIIPQNFELFISDGCSIPVPEGSIDIAYSNQVIEHLHPEDAFEELGNILKALTIGGVYICITPNRLSGPHDISMYFDKVATGFHLKEYTLTELIMFFRKAGFSKISIYVHGKVIRMKFPLFFLVRLYETLLSMLPFFVRKKIVNRLPFKTIIGIDDITLVGTKYN